MEINNYYLDLVTQEPINYNGLIIYQPSFSEIKKIGIDKYYQIMQVFSLTIECFNNIQGSKNIDLFSDIIIQDDFLLYCLGEALTVLTKADEIIFYEKSKYLELKFISKPNDNIENVFNLNSDNFDDISNIILKINASNKVVIENPPENLTPKQRDVWEKLNEGRKNDAKKNEVHLYDILNVCEYGGNYHIPIEEIKTWSLWRIMNCYKSRVGIKCYDDNLKIALITREDKGISGENYWQKQLMIRE